MRARGFSVCFRLSIACLLLCLIECHAHADYAAMLRSGTNRDEVRKLYDIYANEILESTEPQSEQLVELAGQGGYQDSFLLACLSNGWSVRARDINQALLPPSGLWAFSEANYQGLVRQYPADATGPDCFDLTDMGDFSVRSVRIGTHIHGTMYSEPDFEGASIDIDGDRPTMDGTFRSLRLRTPPRADYVTVSQYENVNKVAQFVLHISGANIEKGAKVLINDRLATRSTVSVRMDNSSWLGLGQDLANAGYHFDPTYFRFPIFYYASIDADVKDAVPGQQLSLQIQNPDGQVSNSLTFEVPHLETLDSDGDGLLDRWETDGIDGLDLQAMGANPYRKDLFLEVDRMIVPRRIWSDFSERGYPRADVMESAVQVFRHAPMINPDGTPGIHLHIDYGQADFPGAKAEGGTEIPWHRYVGFHKLKITDESDANFIRPDEYCNATKLRSDSKYFNPNRLKVFRYCVYADQQWSSRSTGGGNQSTIFFLSLGVCRMNAVDHNYQLGVFVHELGHLLGLTHEGGQTPRGWFNYKPNFNSLMNYTFTVSGPDFDGNPKITKRLAASDFVYAYSEGMRAKLDEGKLYEALGVANHYPVDWNGNGVIDADPVVVKLRNPRYKSTDILEDGADWAQLKLPLGRE